jgi:hypothetical protein
MPDAFRLLDACCAAYDNPIFKPSGGKTFCNQAVMYIAKSLGYGGFQADCDANRIISIMETSAEWQIIPMSEAQPAANRGNLVIACRRDIPHGHVAVVRPGYATTSGKWGPGIPRVVNIGATNFIDKGVNYAFQDPPDFYVCKKEGLWNP